MPDGIMYILSSRILSVAEDVEEAPEIEEAKLFVALVRCAATVGSFALPHANEAAVIGTPNQSFIDTSI